MTPHGITFKFWRWRVVINIARRPDALPQGFRKLLYEHFCGYELSIAAFLLSLSDKRNWLTHAVLYYCLRNYPDYCRQLVEGIARPTDFAISEDGQVLRRQPMSFVRFIRLSQLLPLVQGSPVHIASVLAVFFQPSEEFSDHWAELLERDFRAYTHAQQLRLLQPIIAEFTACRKMLDDIRPRKKAQARKGKQDWLDVLHLMAGEQVKNYNEVANLPAATVLLSLVKTANNLPE